MFAIYELCSAPDFDPSKASEKEVVELLKAMMAAEAAMCDIWSAYYSMPASSSSLVLEWEPCNKEDPLTQIPHPPKRVVYLW